jgi:hypothetical protein
MKMWPKIVGFLVVLSVLFISNLRVYGSELCVGKNANLDCLKGNFDVLYEKNNKQFWDILHVSAKNIKNCRSSKDVIKFLELAELKNDNAEFEEFVSEIIEKLCISNTKCLLNAMLKISKQKQMAVIELLQNPTYIEKEKINSAIDKLKDIDKYKSIVKAILHTN